MDATAILQALVLGVVEGVTEFLPISSTGHLIIAGQLIGFTGEKAKVFSLFIQLGAIAAICWEYRARLVAALSGATSDPVQRRFLANLAAAFVPAAGLGFLFGRVIKAHLFHPVPVAVAFVAGGLVILWTEHRPRAVRVERVDHMTLADALKVGVAQAFALLPGTSRSGATIIGGMLFGLSRQAATEFSFFLAVPTLSAAALYDLWKQHALLSVDDIGLFATGFAAAFVSALVVVRGLIRYVAGHDFVPFAWYRIAFGAVVLATAWSGTIQWRPE